RTATLRSTDDNTLAARDFQPAAVIAGALTGPKIWARRDKSATVKAANWGRLRGCRRGAQHEKARSNRVAGDVVHGRGGERRRPAAAGTAALSGGTASAGGMDRPLRRGERRLRLGARHDGYLF